MSRRPLTGVAGVGEPAFIIRGASFENDPRPATALPHVNGRANGHPSPDPLSRAQRISGDPLAQRRQRAAVAALVSPPPAPRSHPGASRAAAPRPWSLSPASPGGRTADAAGVRAELLATRRSLNEALDDLRAARTAAGGDAALHRELADERRRRAELEADVARLRAVVDTQRDDAATSFQAFAAADAAAQRELEFVKEAEEAKREQQAKALEGGIKAQQRAVAAAVKDAKAELRRQFAIEKEELRRSLNETHEAALEAARRSR
jgi:hypothetical protein